MTTLIQGKDYRPFKVWQEKSLTHFKDLFERYAPWKPKPFSTLPREYSLPHTHFLYFSQVTSYWKSLPNQPQQFLRKTMLDKLLDEKQYSIAELYPQLQMIAIPTLELSSMARWNDDLPIKDVTRPLLAGYKDTCKLITSKLWRESQFKILHRAYLSYFHIGKELNPGKTQFTLVCPKCSLLKPTIKHNFWDCPKLLGWSNILP